MTPTSAELRPDDFRSYTLPDSLDATIPTGPVPGEPGIHWVARGLMVETCAELLGRPISLDLYDHPHTVWSAAAARAVASSRSATWSGSSPNRSA